MAFQWPVFKNQSRNVDCENQNRLFGGCSTVFRSGFVVPVYKWTHEHLFGFETCHSIREKVNPSLWKQSKGRRVIVNAHDFGTELATGIFPDEDDKDDDDVYDDNNDKNYQSSSLINTTHFIVSNSECEVEEAPFDAKKDVAVVPSLSFFLREKLYRDDWLIYRTLCATRTNTYRLV